jgi:hypothetical protein
MGRTMNSLTRILVAEANQMADMFSLTKWTPAPTNAVTELRNEIDAYLRGQGVEVSEQTTEKVDVTKAIGDVTDFFSTGWDTARGA